jgi:LAO/AO transport system kinase
MRQFRNLLSGSGSLRKLREAQLRRWFWNEVQAVLAEEISADPGIAEHAAAAEAEVAAGKVLPGAAARRLIRQFRGS